MTEIAVRHAPALPGRLDVEQVRYIAATEFVPKNYRGNLPAIMACIQTGRELGLGDLEALRSINVIDGRPSLSAELMVKLVRARGHSITGKFGADAVEVVGRRADNGDEMAVTWTLAMAKTAGLAEKTNWQRYPSAMLWSRAVSQLCRMLFPDCLRGLSHTDDEVEMTAEERVEEVLATAVPVDVGPVDALGEPESGESVVGSASRALSGSLSAEEEQVTLSFEEQAAQAQRTRAARGTK